MLYLNTSNRYEILRELLLAHLGDAPANPFVMQEIIVPNTAIQSDLERALADRTGVAAGVTFFFPGRWLWQRITALLPEVAKDSPFAPERSVWRIMRLLVDSAFIRQAPALAHYLADADFLMRYELAAKIAALFSAYAIYRPDYLTSWQAGQTIKKGSPLPHEDWQAKLWHKLAAELGLGTEHPALLFIKALGEEPENAGKRPGLPHDLYVFCLHELPPLHLEMLNRISEWSDVHLYLSNPCREYWTDLATTKNRARMEAKGHSDFLPQGHPLLTDWGRQTQTLFTMLLENDAVVETDHFQAGAGESLLIRLQNSILDNESPTTGAWPLSETDRSVEIHVAHSLFRQLEILRDQLLARIKAESSLTISEIVVLLPDLDAAAPWIEAVFARDQPRIPYTVTGVSAARKNVIARLLLALMNLAKPGSRLPASEVFAFLREFAALLGLLGDDAESLCDALKVAGARWGMDAGKEGAPEARHTWRDALARLFLGYALPAPTKDVGENAEPFQGILSAGNLAGSRARILGSAWLFFERLEKLQKALRNPLPAEDWRVLWLQTLDEWLGSGKATAASDITMDAALRQTLAAIHTLCDNAYSYCAGHPHPHPNPPLEGEGVVPCQLHGMFRMLDIQCEGHSKRNSVSPPLQGEGWGGDGAKAKGRRFCDSLQKAGAIHHTSAADTMLIPAEVAIAALEQALQTEAFGAKPSGALTFAQLSALRSLPYRMICVLGLEDGVFPSREGISEFDLMPLRPRIGDRRQNHDERNLFLDTILSARETLYLSYSGRSQRDDSELPPSLLLAQLRDFLCEATGSPPERLQIAHPLQAFSPEYFSGDPRLISFRQDYALALQNAAGNTPAAPFFTSSLPPPIEARLELAELQTFFRHPARALLRDRLGIRLPDAAEETEDIEPQTVLPLPRHGLSQRLLTAAMSGADETRLFRLAQSGVEYPGGRFGEVLLAAETKAVVAFSNRLLPHWRTRQKETREISLTIHNHTLSASLSDLTPGGLFAFRYARAKARDYISTWLAHLFLNADGAMLRSSFFARDEDFSFAPLAKEKAAALLADWLAAWQIGCQTPLAFYPETAWAWRQKGETGGRTAWFGNDYSPAEADDWWQLALGSIAPENALNDDFAHWRERLFSPLQQYLQPLPEQP